MDNDKKMSEQSPERLNNEDLEEAINSYLNDGESSDDFELISGDSLPNPDSEEILGMPNASSRFDMVIGYVHHLWQEPPNVGVFDYFYDWSCNSKAVETEIKDGVRRSLIEVTSPEDEMRRRDCLVKAVSDNCKNIIDHDISQCANEMSLLEKCGCIISEDKRYLDSKSEDPVQRMRALFSMMLDRDLKALLAFVGILKLRNIRLYDDIVSSFYHSMHIGYRVPMKCLQCVLIERVNIQLIADYLDSSRWKKFYKKVSEAKMSDSEGLWKEFFDEVNANSLYSEATLSIIRAIKSCGFHSDILSKFASDSERKDNSFKCKCHEIRRSSSISSRYCEQTSGTTQTSHCSDSTEAGNIHTNPVENFTPTPYTAASRERERTCKERHIKLTRQNSIEVKKEASGLQGHSVTQKRKNADMEENENDERPIKKPAEHSGINGSTDYRKESETSLEKSRTEKISSKNQDNKRKKSDKSAKGDSLENLRMDNLKVAVRGYDSDHDSGFSPDASLKSSNESSIDGQKTANIEETIPKQVVNIPNALPSQNERSTTQESQCLEERRNPNCIKCIDAGSTELSESHVNQEMPEEALEDVSDEDTDNCSAEYPFNRSLTELDEKQNDQTHFGLEAEPFVNLIIKKKKE